MKKGKSKKEKKNKKILTPELPQNIMPIGERVLEDKNIYIHQKVYAQIHKFAANKTENEHGGILVGRVLNEIGKENTIIEGFIEAKYNTATPTTLTFTHETWEHFHSEIDKKFKGKKIVGWIHTHPNFGIFLSENDKFIQENFFSDSNQVAYVVDPIQNEEGFFFWIDKKIERCPGFYLFDKNGAKIKPLVWEEAEDHKVTVKRRTNPLVIVLLVMSLLMNVASFFVLYNKTDTLEEKLEDHRVVLQHGIFYGMDIEELADSINEQLELQRQAEIDAMNEQKKAEEAAEAEADNEESSENAEGEV